MAEDPYQGFTETVYREVRRAKAQECVQWFAIQGPLRLTPRIPGYLLSMAEEANPYDDVNTAPGPIEEPIRGGIGDAVAQVHCPVCHEPVLEWTETAEAVHCKAVGRGWRKHVKTSETSP